MKIFKGKLTQNDLLLILSLVVGVCCGLAATLLKFIIHTLQHWIYSDSILSNSGCIEITAKQEIMLALLPGVGMFLSLLFVKFIVRDNIGHGVTKVLKAVSMNESKIRPHNMWTSLVASGITIGFGGSVGAEAPIVYTGAAIGSNMARKFGLSYKNMTILLGCGAAGAVAGIFKAPLAGMLFTLEILLFNISMSSILPLMISTISATVVSYLFTGSTAMFSCSLEHFRMGNLPFYLILGVFCAFVSLYFTRTTLFVESKVKKVENPYLRWAFSAVGLGLLIFLFPPLFGEGYVHIDAMLSGNSIKIDDISPVSKLLDINWFVPVFFLLVIILKVFSMSLTNAGGGVGGTFGPTLFVGAMAGFVVSRTINLLGIASVPEQNFVLVGMAASMAGVMQAPLTAIFLIAEITGGYDLLLPLILTSCTSYGVNRIFEKYSIYTKRIAMRGELLTHDSDQAVLTLLRNDDLLETDFVTINMEASLKDLTKAVSKSKRNLFPVLDSKG
ncbi:MAG: chloride channel protein, partial [Bacteroidales bacterium]|nr:chloride channel protein [Bacteroidales bacterium]